MGEHADDLIFQGLDSYWGSDPEDVELEYINGASYRRRPRNFQQGIGQFRWRAGSGEILNMWDMTPRHLRNCLRTCEKTGNTGKANDIKEVLVYKQNETPNEKRARLEQAFGRPIGPNEAPGWD